MEGICELGFFLSFVCHKKMETSESEGGTSGRIGGINVEVFGFGEESNPSLSSGRR